MLADLDADVAAYQKRHCNRHDRDRGRAQPSLRRSGTKAESQTPAITFDRVGVCPMDAAKRVTQALVDFNLRVTAGETASR